METGLSHLRSEIYKLTVFIQPRYLIIGMLFFIVVIAGLVLFILFYLARRKARSVMRIQLKEQYSGLISELALCETDEELQAFMNQPATLKNISRLSKDELARKVLITELLKTVNSMSGSAATNMCWFYEQTGLYHDSLARMKTGSWHVKARAIQELSGLAQKKYITRIYRLTNHPHELIRNEARTAVVKLTGFEGLRFLDVISYPLTEWEQLSLLHELSLYKITSFDQVHRWLHSANNSVVEFALRLIEVYQLYNLHDEVLACCVHPSTDVRKKALVALKEIYQGSDATVLQQQFEKEEARLQVMILQVLERAATENELPFLLECLSHPHHEVQAASAKALVHTQPDGLLLIAQRVLPHQYPWTVLLPQLKREVVK